MSTETTDVSEVLDTTTAGETASETTETVETTEAPAWYAKYNATSEDEFDARYQKLVGYEGKEEHLTKEEQRILTLGAQVDKPWHSETFAKMDAFSAKTGIDDVRIISEIMSSTKEDLMANPLEALCLYIAANSADKYKTLGGRAGVMEMLREDYNLPAEGEYTPSKKMIADAFDAVTAIEKIKGDVGEIQNPYNIAQQKIAGEQQLIEQKQIAAIAEYEKVSGELKEVSIKDGEETLSLKVTKEEIDKVFESQKAFLGQAFDVSKKEDREALKAYVEKQVRYGKVDSGELLTEWKNKYAADVARTATQEALNGQVKTPDRNIPANGKELSPIAKVAQAEGKTLPTN